MATRDTITTVKGRFVGGGLFEPRIQEEGRPPKYSACIVLDEGESDKINKIIETARVEKWGNKKPQGLKTWGVREGDDPEFEASFESEFINPKSTRKPQTLVKRDNMYVEVSEDDDVLYPGCYVAVSVGAYGYDEIKEKNVKAGLSLNVRAVMFTKHGERLGDSINAENEFDGIESENDDDDFLAAS